MRTGIFYKRIIKKLLGALSLGIVFVCFVYACVLSTVQTYTVGKTFYFLVSSSSHIGASTHIAQNLGGAGFLFFDGETDYVAYAAYENQTDGANAQRELKRIGEDALLLPVTVETLYFKSSQDKKTQESSPTPQFKSINSLVLCLLHSTTLTSIYDHRKNHSLD